jgi:cell division protein FtsB
MKIQQFGNWIRDFLNHPRRVALVCLLFVILSAVFNGVLWRLWALHRDQDRRQHEMLVAQQSIVHLKTQLEQARDPAYIERQARDRLDLASEKDLVFVFPTQ